MAALCSNPQLEGWNPNLNTIVKDRDNNNVEIFFLLELREVGVPRGLRVRDRLGLAGQAALAHEAADREARRVGELARL